MGKCRGVRGERENRKKGKGQLGGVVREGGRELTDVCVERDEARGMRGKM